MLLYIVAFLSIIGAIWIIFILDLPKNAFSILISATAVLDVFLVVAIIHHEAVPNSNIPVVLNEAVLDISITLALALGWVAYAVISGHKSITYFSPPLMLVLCLIPGFAHIAAFGIALKYARTIHSVSMTIIFGLIMFCYLNSIIELRYLEHIKFRNLNGIESRRHKKQKRQLATSLMFRLIISFTVVNLITWFPHILATWYRLFGKSDFIKDQLTNIEKMLIEVKGLGHALAVAYGMWHKPTPDKFTELDDQNVILMGLNNKPLPIHAIKNKKHSHNSMGDQTTVKDSWHLNRNAPENEITTVLNSYL